MTAVAERLQSSLILPPSDFIMRRLLLLLALASLFFIATGSSVDAQSGISVADASFKLDYPTQMTFHLNASSAAPITAAELVVRYPLSSLTTRLKPNFTPGTQIDTNAIWRFQSVNAAGGYLPPGATGEYSWHLEDQSGNKFDTPFQPLRVEDNRRTWKKIENAKIALYWYDGAQDFGQAIFDKATKTLAAIQDDIGATIGTKIQIFIYGDRQDFLTALAPGQHEWAGGTIDETFTIVLIDASASELDYALEATPHELSHLVTHAAVRGPYSGIAVPLWMDEGLAVYHEYTPPQNEVRFDVALKRGIQSDTLLRFRALAQNFPSDPTLAEMAYGEAYSAVDFMVRTYGRDKLKQLMSQFQAGTTPDDAFQRVLGVDEDGLENAWRKSVGAQVKDYPKAPTLAAGAVPTFAFSSAETPGAVAPPAPLVAQQPTPALTPSAVPVPSPTPTPASSGGAGSLCGGVFGVMGLAAFGLWKLTRR